jgi:diketogulonate reductase-like aldo/keto reductase
MAPTFVYGTAWKEEHTETLVTKALAAGFRAFDTANQRKHYFEAAVGAALRGHPRDELWLQTKFTHLAGQDDRLPYDPRAPIGDQVQQSFASSLEHLGTTYLDSLVLHGPNASRGLAPDDVGAWQAMEAIHAAGGTKALGISNVALDQLELLMSIARVRPTYVQNRCYARRGWDRPIRAFCREVGIVYQGFSLLTANRAELASPTLDGIVRRTHKTREQIIFRFAIQVGMLPLTGTSSEAHMREDLAVADFTLTDREVHAIETIAG